MDLMHFQPNLSTAFIDTDKLILICTWKGKATTITKAIFKKSNKVGEIMLSDFKSSYKVTAINLV